MTKPTMTNLPAVMDKRKYAIVTPNPSGESKFLVIEAKYLGEVFSDYDDYGRTQYKVKIVERTEKWFKQYPEL